MLKYKPDEFRSLSMGEFTLALEGYGMANGTYKGDKLTWNDVLDAEEALLCR